MAEGSNMVELKTQEIVFLGNLFVNPSEMDQHATVVEENRLISSEPAKGIWSKIYKHYTKYGALPDEALLDGILTEKELENLKLGIAIAGSEAAHAGFILDTFADTAKTILYKRSMATFEKLFEDGKADLEHANEALSKLTNDLSIVDRNLSGEFCNMTTILDQWSSGSLMMQAPRVPIPIPGLDFIPGTPPGSVNVLVGGYGSGKTASLCTMAANLCQNQNVLYVTLEMPAEAISFRILSCRSKGAIASNQVFLDPRSFDDAERDRVERALIASDCPGSVYLLDLPAGTASPAQLELYMHNLIHRNRVPINVVIVDYAALMRTNSGAGREDIGWGYTGVILKELAAVAKKMGVTIWAAAQAGGDAAHAITTGSGDFKPLRGGNLYGSKEVLQDASLVFGLSLMRNKEYPHLAAGVLTTIKNRYGSEFYDYVCSMDYSTSTLQVKGILQETGEGDIIQVVMQAVRELGSEYGLKNALKKKEQTNVMKEHLYQSKAQIRASGGAQTAKQLPGGSKNKSVTAEDSREVLYG